MNQRRLRASLVFSAFGATLCAGVSAQSVCFEPISGAIATNVTSAMTLADLDGDGDRDVVVSSAAGTSVLSNSGAGGFAAPVLLASGWSTRFVAADFDADSDVDLALTGGEVRLLRNQGGGVFVAQTLTTDPFLADLVGGDLDGDSDIDLVAASSLGPARGLLLRNQGNGTFTQMSFDIPYSGDIDMELADVDGDGDLDLIAVHGDWTQVSIQRNDGNGFFFGPTTLLAGFTDPLWLAAGDLNGDGYPDIAVVDLIGRNLSTWLSTGGGAYGPRRDQSTGTGVPSRVAFADVDADGDLDVAVSLAFPGPSSGGVALFANDGTGTLTAATGLPISVMSSTFAWADLESDGDLDVVIVSTTHSVHVARNCANGGRPFCAGDGSATSCPCANNSAPGSLDGCVNSFGTGARLRGTGSLALSNDTFALHASGMPSQTMALFFQGTTAVGGGLGAVFGDGLRCAVGSVVRLGTRMAVSGAASIPGPGDPPISVAGQVSSAGLRVYQVLYRDPASFCTVATFNQSNALDVDWR